MQRSGYWAAILTFAISALNFGVTFTYKSESEIYYSGAIDTADMTESEIDLIYNSAWVFSLDAFA